MLSGLAQTLNQLAFEFNLAVVVTNHITTRFDRATTGGGSSGGGGGGGGGGSGSGASYHVPALGEQWSHCITNRIMLGWDGGTGGMGGPGGLGLAGRRAEVAKSPAWPVASCSYQVCKTGIRDAQTVRQDSDQNLFKLDVHDTEQSVSIRFRSSLPLRSSLTARYRALDCNLDRMKAAEV